MFLTLGVGAHQQEQERHQTGPSSVLFVMSGVSGAIGITALVVALSDRRDVYVKDRATLLLSPTFTPTYAGARLALQF